MLDITFPQCMRAPDGDIVRFHDENSGELYLPLTNSFRQIEDDWVSALSGFWTPCSDPTKPNKTKILLDHVRNSK